MTSIPYSCQNISEEDVAAVVAVLRSEYLTQGPAVPAFESAFSIRHQVDHAVAVSNATAGLHIACLALGVGPSSRVWTSPNSFLASANCALYCGAQIDFVDIDPWTRNLGLAPLREKLLEARARNALPDVVIPVDFAGLPCPLLEIRALADEFGFRVLQDASHAAGATYRGHPVGSHYADISVFSFHAVKIVTTAEGGMVTTRDASLAKRLRLLRSHGMTREAADLQHPVSGAWVYEQQLLGFNYRMTDLQAALGTSQLARMESLHAQRITLAGRYDELLRDFPVITPPRDPVSTSSWHLYAIEIDETRTDVTRAAAFSAMRRAGIGVNVHYIPIHLQPYYAHMGFAEGDFPAAEHYYRRAISLPLFPALSQVDQTRVVDQLRVALGV
jgi:UDP-4-amino-4,6-dideoxy-N-acetyl-beta-L-altrosamine transaminase